MIFEAEVRLRALDGDGHDVGWLRTVRARSQAVLLERLSKVMTDFEARLARRWPPRFSGKAR